jgi:hypothetical protein
LVAASIARNWVSAAVTIALLLAYVFGSVEDNLLAVTAGLTLGVLATGLALLGLGWMFGRIGLAVGAAVAVLVGNPLSGLSSAPERRPQLGRLRAAVAAGRQRHPAALHGLLLRSRCDDRRRRAELLGAGGRRAHRHHPGSPTYP